MANPSLPLYVRFLLIAATVLVWQACHAQPGYQPNYQPVIELAPEEDLAALSEQPASEHAERNVFLSMLSRAQTANQLAALSFEPLTANERATMGEADVGRLGVPSANSAGPEGDGLVALLVIAFLAWYFSFRR
jgi:hypothetical protein